MKNYTLTIVLICLCTFASILTGCVADETKTNVLSPSDTYLQLAEQYALSQIPNVERQQEFWQNKYNSDNISINTDIKSARVEFLDLTVNYKNYQVFKFNASYLPDDAEKICYADEWALTKDGWYMDLRPQYMIFTNIETPQLIGIMMCEFTPDGNSDMFYSDLDKWIAEVEKLA